MYQESALEHKRKLIFILLIIGLFLALGMTLLKPMTIPDPNLFNDKPSELNERGHYTRIYIERNIMPTLTRDGFPFKVSDDVILENISSGPGSTITTSYLITDSFAQIHSKEEVLNYVCSNKQLRETLVSKLDSYDYEYRTKDKYLYKVKMNEEICQKEVKKI